MKKALAILGALVALAVLATLALIYVPVKVTPPNEALAADWKAEPGRGKICHARWRLHGLSYRERRLAPGRRPRHPTPMGTIWSSNITPDKETGIGDGPWISSAPPWSMASASRRATCTRPCRMKTTVS